MLDFLNTIDIQLFSWLNSIHSPFWDPIVAFISGPYSFLWLYILLLILSYLKLGWRKFLLLLVFIGLLIFIADSGSVHLFKNVFQRLRPSQNPDLADTIHLVNNYKGGLYGFISSHAANSSAIAGFFILLLNKKWLNILLIFYAIVFTYSRIYLGVHYPFDILCGWIWGTIASFISYYLYRKTIKRIFSQN